MSGNFGDISYGLTIGAGQGIQRNAGNTGFEAIYTNPDYYKYSIVPSIDGSGNLTIALKNYLGDDPSTAVPVKIQIGDTIRTITSALSVAANAGTNWFNCGSSELATKEVDIFVYLYVNTGSVGIATGRIPYGIIGGDFTAGTDIAEKSIQESGTYVSTDPFVNIGRFSAILSASPYTWSEPASGFQVINRPIYETKWLQWNPTFSTSGTAFTNPPAVYTNGALYKLNGNTINIKLRMRYNATSGGTGNVGATLPMSALIAYQSGRGTSHSTGKSLRLAIGTTLNVMAWSFYDNTTPIENNFIDELGIYFPLS